MRGVRDSDVNRELISMSIIQLNCTADYSELVLRMLFDVDSRSDVAQAHNILNLGSFTENTGQDRKRENGDVAMIIDIKL